MIGIKMNQVLVVALALTCAAAEPLAKPDVTDGKQELVRVPAYTMWHKDLNVALAELKRHLLRQDVRDNNPNDPFIQYVMIVNVVNQLIDISLGNEFKYNMVFYNVVPAVILETIKNPQDSADKVRVQADRSYAKTSAIRDLIDTKQRKVCKDPNAYACDVIVDIAVQTSGDDLLKRQAHLMQTLSVEFELFLQDYANEFNDVSKDKKAIAYLINGIERLRPLVMIAGKARKESKSTPPIQFRSTGRQDGVNSIIALVSLCAVSTSSQYSGYPVKIQQQHYYPANYPAQTQQRQYYPTHYPVQVQQQQYYPVQPQQQYYPVQPQRVVGPSPYGLQIPSYLIGRTYQPTHTLIPPYTSIVKAFDEASNEIKEHILFPVKPLPHSTLRKDIVIGGKFSKIPPTLQYATILTTINDLIDGLINTNKGAMMTKERRRQKANEKSRTQRRLLGEVMSSCGLIYDMIYETIVKNVIIKILSDPVSATNSIKARLDETYGQIALIRDFIRKKQQADCKDLISHQCDTIIDKAVQQSTDPLLKHEAKLLTALYYETKLFNTQYASEFDRVANSLGGAAYVVNDYGRSRLKQLVLAGYEARKISQNAPSTVGKRRTPYPLLLNRPPDITLAPFLGTKQTSDITLVPSSGNKQTPDITLVPFLGNKQTLDITLAP